MLLKDWNIEYESGIPVYRQIVNRVCSAVATGDIEDGEQLPTIRALSGHLKVNPNTVAKAYRELELRGIITGERGSGSFVQAPLPPPATPPREKKAALENLYRRLLGEAASSGVTERELLNFLKKRTPNTL